MILMSRICQCGRVRCSIPPEGLARPILMHISHLPIPSGPRLCGFEMSEYHVPPSPVHPRNYQKDNAPSLLTHSIQRARTDSQT